MKVGYHNHSWEFESIGDTTPHQLMRQYLDASVFFEVDTYWAQTAGADAAQVVKELGSRAPLLHIKDGPATKEAPMTAVGEGKMDVPAIVKAGEGSTEWLIVELDRCATDMMEAVEKSYTYLVGKGLARGNRS
jgi:sugar phosphate isomerase/epimerase